MPPPPFGIASALRVVDWHREVGWKDIRLPVPTYR